MVDSKTLTIGETSPLATKLERCMLAAGLQGVIPNNTISPAEARILETYFHQVLVKDGRLKPNDIQFEGKTIRFSKDAIQKLNLA